MINIIWKKATKNFIFETTKSSIIKYILYNKNTKDLQIFYKNDTVYTMHNIEKETIKEFEQAESKGNYISKIRFKKREW